MTPRAWCVAAILWCCVSNLSGQPPGYVRPRTGEHATGGIPADTETKKVHEQIKRSIDLLEKVGEAMSEDADPQKRERGKTYRDIAAKLRARHKDKRIIYWWARVDRNPYLAHHYLYAWTMPDHKKNGNQGIGTGGGGVDIYIGGDDSNLIAIQKEDFTESGQYVPPTSELPPPPSPNMSDAQLAGSLVHEYKHATEDSHNADGHQKTKKEKAAAHADIIELQKQVTIDLEDYLVANDGLTPSDRQKLVAWYQILDYLRDECLVRSL